MAKETNKSSSNHSFYKEAKKSFYGSEGFSKEKTWKIFKKGTKWFIYGFLTVTTLWGCVNEFIIGTGNQLGTGVEFSSKTNQVVPNMYATETEMVWEAKGPEEIEPEQQEINNDFNKYEETWKGTELKPFDIATFNPYYGYSEEELEELGLSAEDIDTSATIVPVEKNASTNSGQISSSTKYGIYNLAQLSENKAETTESDISSSLYISGAFPKYLKTDADGDSDIDNDDDINGWSDFYVDRLEENAILDPEGNSLGLTINAETLTFTDPNTNKYFKIIESTDDEGNPEAPEISARGGWYAKPNNNNNNNNNSGDPKNDTWRIVADSSIAKPMMLHPTFEYNEDGEIIETPKQPVSKESVNAFATNTAIFMANEAAFYTGEEIAIDNTLGELLGIVEDSNGDSDAEMQIKKMDVKSEEEDSIDNAKGTYKGFYSSVKSESEEAIDKTLTIEQIAIDSTWNYMTQYAPSNEFEQYYETLNKKDITISNSEYSADYTELLTTSSEGSEINHGQAYSINNANSKKPTIPTYDALYTMQNLRPDDFANKDVKKELRNNKKLNDIYVDPATQLAGWGLLDENGNLQIIANDNNVEDYYIIQQVYDDPTISFYDKDGNYDYDKINSPYEDLSEKEYYAALEPLFALDRTRDWAEGNVDNIGPPQEKTINGDVTTDIDYHFDKMIDDYTNSAIYTAYYEAILPVMFYNEEGSSATKASEIKYNSYEVAYASSVAGVQAAPDEYSKSVDGVGTATPTGWTENPVDKTALDNSLWYAKGFDEANNERASFAGWSDWGWAWNVKFGPLYGLFLFPISQVALFVQHVIFPFNFFGAWGILLGVFFIVFLLRGLGTLMSLKSTSNQQKMQEVQMEVAKINAKYEKYGKNKQMKQRKQMEVMALYRKKEVNPLGSFGTIFITMPIFISMWILISAIPVYKIAAIGNFSFSVSALSGIFSSLFILYLMVGISVGLMQGLSAKLPSWLAQKRKGVKQVTEAEKKAAKKQNKTQNIMVGVFIVIGLTVPVLLAFYWISSASFTICLELGRHEYQVRKGKKVKKEK